MSLTRHALEVLQDPSAAPGLRQVACQTLLSAIDAGVEVSAGTHMAVWRYLLGSDATSVALHRHEIDHPEVARAAIDVLLNRDSGDGARDLAIAALRGANVDQVSDAALATIADRLADEGQVRRLTFLVERVHEHRGLSDAMIAALRDRLVGSDLAAVRAAGVEIGSLLARLDEYFARRLLADPSPVVRSAVVDQLEKVATLDRDGALVILKEHLGVEAHRSVLSTCYYVLAALIRTGGRRVRQWEPPEEN